MTVLQNVTLFCMKMFKKSKKKIKIPQMWNTREDHKVAVTVLFEYLVS